MRPLVVLLLLPLLTLTPVHAATPGSTLVRSLAGMKRLHTVHGTAVLAGRGTRLVMSGDCSGQVPWGHRAYSSLYKSSARGTLSVGYGSVQRIDESYIAIRTPTRITSWQRTDNGPWQLSQARPPVNAVYALQLCMPLYANSFAFPTHGWVAAGTRRIGGVRAQEIELRQKSGPGETTVTVIDVDPHTLYWLRFAMLQQSGRRTVGSEIFTYSRFNHPVSIQPPQ